ncbi:HIT family protein [Natronosporangium hydrolyticum]|uniref:HIT family protein n=1 Tax=Natronosporangium hydrolyticum TaxID=2811111 RepID=A0A895Y8C0_9ACTN|nr:HIT family protein [Natronosporangium hydrolyticum]QSB13957.1 HIT family protein [Natronosporangium hydrolyticum]
MTGCPFCAVVAGEAPGFVVLDAPAAVGFLDTRPVFPGHVLVVPRAHVETLTDLATDALGGFFAEVQRVAAALPAGLGAQGSFVAINNRVSQSVAHLHVHVIPRTKGDGLRGFLWPRRRYADEAEAVGYRDRIAAALPPPTGTRRPIMS